MGFFSYFSRNSQVESLLARFEETYGLCMEILLKTSGTPKIHLKLRFFTCRVNHTYPHFRIPFLLRSVYSVFRKRAGERPAIKAEKIKLPALCTTKRADEQDERRMKMLPPTSTRVADHTSDSVNRKIREQTERNVREYASKGSIAISKRLAELEEEWDIERTLEANAASLILIGLGLGTLTSKKWFVLPGVVSAFLLQHALQGWCPPVPIFRRRGVRTTDEINAEKFALKALRGDFEPVYDKSPYEKVDFEKAIDAAMA